MRLPDVLLVDGRPAGARPELQASQVTPPIVEKCLALRDQIAVGVRRLHRPADGVGNAPRADLISDSTFLCPMNPRGTMAALFSKDITAVKLVSALRACRAMMGHIGGMRWVMGLLWLIVVLMLAEAALAKYLFHSD